MTAPNITTPRQNDEIVEIETPSPIGQAQSHAAY